MLVIICLMLKKHQHSVFVFFHLFVWFFDKDVVTLDAVIRAMRETGENMLSMYKETSEGGLALQISVGIPTC
ncbi:MAG: L-serine dehydratase [Parachlamydiales bacterium]|nr:L-serine dehydratase [Parachlamydiales bacterium]